jgi:hypothetical protein
MDIGFTGTRKGMSSSQTDQLYQVLSWFEGEDKFFHGDAEGSDKQAAKIAMEEYGMMARPIRIKKGETPLQRDDRLVKEIECLIAAPFQNKEIIRSGTWYTVRQARKKGIPIIFLTR